MQWSLILFLALAEPAILPAQAPLPRPAQVQNSRAIQAQAWQIVTLANQARASAGVSPLQWDSALAAAAMKHCQLMAAEGPISHRYQGELELSERAGQAGAHFSLIEENVAIGPDPSTIHYQWMHSAGHRSNLLNADVDRVGVAVVASRGGLYAVADYAHAVPLLTQTQVETSIAGLLRARRVVLLPDATAARAACVLDQGSFHSLSGPQPRFIIRWQDADLAHLPQALIDRLASGNYRQTAVGSCPAQGLEDSFTAYRAAVLLY